MKKVFFVIILFTALLNLQAQTSIEGNWGGNINIMGKQLGIFVHFVNESGSYSGTIDIPSQGANGMRLSNITIGKSMPESILFTLEVPTAPATFDGYYYMDDSLSGKFTQAGFEGTFLLTRVADKKEEKKEDKKESKSYKEEEVNFTNGDNYFAGTLTLPLTKGKHPAVIMITGSGPQDRNEEIFGFKIFEIIADHFTKNGIAVLRYDDRNVGSSKGTPVSESTSEDFAGDVIEAVKYLKTRSDINPNMIGLMGHSEGGMIAPMVAVKMNNDLAFIVLMAGPAVTGSEIIKEQSRLINEANGKYDEKENEETQIFLDAMSGKISIDSLTTVMRSDVEKEYNDMSDEQKSQIKDKDAYIDGKVKAVISSFDNVWMKFFLKYDPRTALEKVTIPVLALFGGKDLQVPVKQNEAPMREALMKAGNTHYKIRTFDDANHLFQQAVSGSPNEYATLKKEFVPGFLEYITTWMLQYVTPTR